MTQYTFSKGTVEKYDIRWNRGEWAVFTIDNARGLMQCHSSYGDWGYSWPNHGRKSFKHFILELERDYTYRDWETDRKSTRLNSSHLKLSRMPSSA